MSLVNSFRGLLASRHFRPAAAFAAMLLSATHVMAADAEKHLLRYKFTAGETVRTEVMHRATIDTTIQGSTQTAETRSGSVKVWHIADVSRNGDVKFVHSVASIDMWQKLRGHEEVTYNSQTDKTPPPGYEDAAKAVGVPLSIITMNARGQVVKREEQKAGFAASSDPLTVELPEKSVGVGDHWSRNQETQLHAKSGAVTKVQLRQAYTLKAIADGIATIAVETQVLTPVNDPALEAQLIQRLSEGEAKFNIAEGRIVEQQFDLDRRVIGFNGPASSLHYLTRWTEKSLPDEPKTARR